MAYEWHVINMNLPDNAFLEFFLIWLNNVVILILVIFEGVKSLQEKFEYSRQVFWAWWCYENIWISIRQCYRCFGLIDNLYSCEVDGYVVRVIFYLGNAENVPSFFNLKISKFRKDRPKHSSSGQKFIKTNLVNWLMLSFPICPYRRS